MRKSELLCDVIDNALLHLYLSISENSRFSPILKRNEILVRYLKGLVKAKAYNPIRKDLKNILFLGKQANCQLENKLVELRELPLTHKNNTSDTRRLFDVLTQVEIQLGLQTQFLNDSNSELPEPDTIYMIQDQVESGFIQSGKQVAPVSLFLEFKKADSVLEFINASGLLKAKLHKSNKCDERVQIVLSSNN